MKKICVLGSTGSIGTQTLAVADMYPELIEVTGLLARSNGEKLLEQIIKYHPVIAGIVDETEYGKIKDRVPVTTELICGENALIEMALRPESDTLVVAVVGIAGLPAVMAGLKSGKHIALANKEALVTGGGLVTELAKEMGEIIYPVDSEHSAIFQCLRGQHKNEVSRIILTASGGPFRSFTAEQMKKITVADALCHPTWSMGRKITVDCATMMNKGLEVIEAYWLFGVDKNKIHPIIHPESIVHSAVEFIDGAVIAQLGEPDMRLPILYALNYPSRLPCGAKTLDLAQREKLTFFEPDYEKFPCLALAFKALEMGGTAPTVLNAANEAAVDLFLREKIGFCDIPDIIEHNIFNTKIIDAPSIDDVYSTDRAVRTKIYAAEA